MEESKEPEKTESAGVEEEEPPRAEEDREVREETTYENNYVSRKVPTRTSVLMFYT